MPLPKPLPKPNVEFAASGTSREDLTTKQLRGMFCNPIYAGVGEYPAMVSDDQWVGAARKLIRDEGEEQFLVNLLFVLRQTFGDPRQNSKT